LDSHNAIKLKRPVKAIRPHYVDTIYEPSIKFKMHQRTCR